MMHLILAAALGASPANGGSLFATHCSSCHGAVLQGSADGPPLIGASAANVDFMLETGRMPAALPGIEPTTKRPSFSESEIRVLVAYVAEKGRGDPRLPVLEDGDRARGRALFAADCAQCHGVSGHGASVGFANVAPSLMDARGRQVLEALRTGPGEMPRFGDDVVSDRDANDIVAYVAYLQHEKAAYNPGGLQLANVGPVAEGFVAWIIGLGALILFIRLIGSND